MSQERAVFWLGVLALICVGLLLEQWEAVSVTAMVSAIMAYQETKPKQSGLRAGQRP